MSLQHILMVFLLLMPATFSYAQEIDCLKCHAKLKKEKVVHPALEMGCPTCHVGIDASKVPHKMTNAIARGLSADQPDLCYGCHDKAAFSKKNVHAAVGMGCTGCHNPHSSKNAKLLIAEPPDLCFTCHDKAEFTKKTVHPALDMGCTTCHVPHSSDDISLLKKKPIEVCLECHADVPKKNHAVSGFSEKSHPLGVKRKGKKSKDKDQEKTEDKGLMDPSRPDRPFFCGSCHNPHSTEGPRLFRFKATSSMGLCPNCHMK